MALTKLKPSKKEKERRKVKKVKKVSSPPAANCRFRMAPEKLHTGLALLFPSCICYREGNACRM